MFSLTKLVNSGSTISNVTGIPEDKNSLYLTTQGGLVVKYDRTTGSTTELLDLRPELRALISDKPNKSGLREQRGLYALALHPEFDNNESPFYRVFYTLEARADDPDQYCEILRENVVEADHMTCLVQYQLKDDKEETKATQRSLLCIPEPESTNNGTDLVFGPDGTLWIGVGDGGGIADPNGPLLDPEDENSYLGFAQDLHSLHGKLLRIGVLTPKQQDKSGYDYAIPRDNPFYRLPKDGLPEIAAWGFRYPRHMTFDQDGRLWVADAGQSGVESVMLIQELGKNYGWRATQGGQIYNKSVYEHIMNEGQVITPPILSYRMASGSGSSIVGAIPYRGTNIPELEGKVLLADVNGRLMVATPSSENGFTVQMGMIIDNMLVSSLNQTEEGELLLGLFNPQNGNGMLVQLGPGSGSHEHMNKNKNKKYDGKSEDCDDWSPFAPWGGILVWIILIIVIIIIIATIIYAISMFSPKDSKYI